METLPSVTEVLAQAATTASHEPHCSYETARAEEILSLNIEDLDIELRRARVVSKGGAIEYVRWRSTCS
ncbi:hypothetical protein ACOZ38_20695 [Sphaerisporangium viridialbum]|uniref:hypothetical protein n=1 Tax=Sphaerisporangium viridialbum TaxID=46189 RepID=UPI003C730120